jgi:YVTN family beta-propeller protein
MRTSMRTHPLHAILFALLLFSACSGHRDITLPGRLEDGIVRLPNGWYLSPAGSSIDVGELPLNMDVSPDGRWLIVTNNGTRNQNISIIALPEWRVVQTVPVPKAWLGIRFFDQGRRFVASGGNDNMARIFSFADGQAAQTDSIIFGVLHPVEKLWLAGCDVDEASGVLYVVGKESRMLYRADLGKGAPHRSLVLPSQPYTVLVSRRSPYLYVSLWGGASIAVVNGRTMSVEAVIPVGDHPTDMVESPDGKRLYVANANENTVSVIDADGRRVVETLCSALTPRAPAGSTPNALALTADGTHLYVANADNNYVAVMDVSRSGRSRSLGFIPVGWYPTSLRILRSTGELLVANGKGAGSRANLQGPDPTRRSRTEEYIGAMFTGTVSRIPAPTDSLLSVYSTAVYRNTRYTDQRHDAPGRDTLNPVPSATGGASPIKHVFYVIKENRTYDQVFGDMPEGNGDAALCLFPEEVTPNHHALAREFVLLDNLYADAEVSADGHNWSMGAYATDYTEKTWPTSYGGRGGEYEYEGGFPIVYPSAGYLWDNCRRHGISYRSYGEFAQNPSRPGDSARATISSLEGHVAPFYRGWDMHYSDVERAREWMKEFDAYEASGDLPRFQIIKLPNDHTEGTRKGSLTPRAYVAQNDLALGMVVERISRSRFWKESAIFVIEDDAQNGPDHVDAHRTVALVISPYVKRRSVDSELYSTTSMVRTMELILGLPPLSQFDAAATPMYASFTAAPDTTPFVCRPARTSLLERNPDNAYGQLRSEEMDFSRQDAIPDEELSEIVWRSVRGAESSMPPPVRSAFVRVVR